MARKPVNTKAKYREVAIDGAARLLTLEDPTAKIVPANLVGVFVRLRPPPDTPPDVIERWRDAVAKHARAVRVLPVTRAEVVATSTRVDVRPVMDVREVIAEVVAETNLPLKQKTVLGTMCETIMSEVGL